MPKDTKIRWKIYKRIDAKLPYILPGLDERKIKTERKETNLDEKLWA